jgi:hypothetical protein
MTDHHFGTSVNPAHFVELAGVSVAAVAGGTVKVSPRPAAGVTLQVRDASTLTALTSITLDENGYWSYTTVDVPAILVSGDSGITWVGPLYSAEANAGAVESGVNAQQALTNAASAIATAEQALAIAQASSGGGTGAIELVYETSAGVYPLPVGTVARVFVGSVRPTEAQGRRSKDFWWNSVLTS